MERRHHIVVFFLISNTNKFIFVKLKQFFIKPITTVHSSVEPGPTHINIYKVPICHAIQGLSVLRTYVRGRRTKLKKERLLREEKRKKKPSF